MQAVQEVAIRAESTREWDSGRREHRRVAEPEGPGNTAVDRLAVDRSCRDERHRCTEVVARRTPRPVDRADQHGQDGHGQGEARHADGDLPEAAVRLST